METKETLIEPLYKNPMWKSRLHRIKRDGHHGHYDCGPNYFSVFPFFVFIQSFATTVVMIEIPKTGGISIDTSRSM